MRAAQLGLAAWVLAAGAARAQEAMHTEAATMPSPGTGVLREQVHFSTYGADPASGAREFREAEVLTGIQWGLARAVSVSLEVPVVFRLAELPGGDDHDLGVEDLQVQFKWRVVREDTGGVDTFRVALLGGAAFASGDDHDFSSLAFNPHVGAVLTLVRGRHGFNQDVKLRWNTGGASDFNTGGGGEAEALFLNSAYVFRLYPARYTSETQGAWYTTVELSAIAETNGDKELRWAPGIMYEGRSFAFEAMVQLPLWHDLDERAELDLSIGVGLRLAF